MSNEKYVIYRIEGTSSKKYIYTIYRNSTSESSDIGNAIEFENKELALSMKDYLSNREKENYKVLCIKTTIDEEVE